MKCLEDLSEKREAISKEIMTEEEEKTKLENDMRIFAERLARINESLAKKIQVRWNLIRRLSFVFSAVGSGGWDYNGLDWCRLERLSGFRAVSLCGATCPTLTLYKIV